MQSCNGLNLKMSLSQSVSLRRVSSQKKLSCTSSSIRTSFWRPPYSTCAGSASKGLQDPSRRKHKSSYASGSDRRRSLCTGDKVLSRDTAIYSEWYNLIQIHIKDHKSGAENGSHRMSTSESRIQSSLKGVAGINKVTLENQVGEL